MTVNINDPKNRVSNQIFMREALKLSVLAIGCFVEVSTFAASSIRAPEEIVVLAVNGQAVKNNLFKSTKDYQVDAGQLSLSVRYQEYFDHRNGQHDILKSAVVNLDIPSIQDNQHYQLKLVNPPKDFDAAQKYVEQPTIALFDQNNQLILQQTADIGAPKPNLLSGLFSKTADFTQSKPTHQAVPIVSHTPSVSASVSNINNSLATQNADEQLIQMWKKASKVERQKFMTWLAEQ